MKTKQFLLFLFVALNTLFGSLAFGQNAGNSSASLKITGSVVDENNEALIGATVAIKDGSGTITDVSGNFSIACKKGAILTVNYIGYESQNIVISEQKPYKISLKTNTRMLDEVVAIGYGSSKRKDLTGSISAVNSETLAKTGATNFSTALQGRVAGVKVNTQSGEAGAGVDIIIRGQNTLYAGSTPLYIIDGMQIDINSSEVATSTMGGGQNTYNPLSSLNPSDIESIDILKDASATAIYGARGANGVIIVTTKSAKNTQKTDVTFNFAYGVSQISKTLNMLNAQDYVKYRFARGGTDATTVWGKDYGDGNGIVPIDIVKNNLTAYDWQNEITKIGTSQNYDISLNSVLLNKTRISSSIGYYNQDGVMLSNGFKRYSGRIKVDHEITKKLKMGASVTIGRVASDGAMSNGGTSGSGGFTGLVQLMYLQRPVNIFSTAELGQTFGGVFIPLASMVSTEAYKQNVSDRLLTGAYVSYLPITGLELKLNGTTSNTASKLSEFYSTNTNYGNSVNGRGGISTTSSDAFTLTATANYNKTFLKNHQISALLGAEMNSYIFESFSEVTQGFDNQSTGVFDLSKGITPQKPSTNFNETTRASLFSRLSYTYLGRYYLTANLRADASSNFAPAVRTGYFPSVSLAWRASDESFMKPLSFISNLKFRASAGTTGNDRIPAYLYLAQVSPDYYGSNGVTLTGLAMSAPGNKDLRWETTDQYNGGLDLGLFNNRVSVVADIYSKDTRNMLLNAFTPGQTGVAKQWMNIGMMSNMGIEVSLVTRNIEKKNFTWSSTLNVDANRSKVLELGGDSFFSVTVNNGSFSNGNGTEVGRVIVGQPIGTIYGYVADGNYQLSDFVCKDNTGAVVDPSTITSLNQKNYSYTLKPGVVNFGTGQVYPGDRKLKDFTGDNVITNADKQVLGNSEPLFNFGLSNDFKIYDFDFSFFIEGSYGGKILNAFRAGVEPSASNSNWNISVDSWQNRWTPENASNTYAALLNHTTSYNYLTSNYVEDGSYIRLKNIVLGYTLNKKLMAKLGISKARLYVLMDNVFVLTKYTGLDPDVSSPVAFLKGMDQTAFPRTRNITMGLNINF